MVHHLPQLIVIHLPPLQNHQCLLLKSIEPRAFRALHLGFDLGQLLVALVDLYLDHLASRVKLQGKNDNEGASVKCYLPSRWSLQVREPALWASKALSA